MKSWISVMLVLMAFPWQGQVSCAAEEDEGSRSVRGILPSATDSRIDTFTGEGWEHWVYFNPAAMERHQLVVFLPGTGGKGHGAKAFNNLAANQGFHVISLAYPTAVSMSAFHDLADPDAFLKARENVIYGKAPYRKLKINEANSIQNRLLKLIQHLAAQFPKEHWEQYLAGPGAIAWSKLILTGQSQGGGHAALMAMQHEVSRVLMFGAPKDFNIHFNQPARWFSGPSATPLNRFFSFVHVADAGHGCSYAQQLENYRTMKLLPQYPVINVDDHSAPYEHSRLLTSKRPQENPHGSVIQDREYATAWKYLLIEPVK